MSKDRRRVEPKVANKSSLIAATSMVLEAHSYEVYPITRPLFTHILPSFPCTRFHQVVHEANLSQT